MPPKLRRSVRAERLLKSYTQYSRDQATFVEMRRKYRQQLGPDFRESDSLQSTYSEVKLQTDPALVLLQPEFLGEEISGSSLNISGNSSNSSSDEDSSDEDLVDDSD